MVVTHGSFPSARGRSTLTIGNFDGVHRGHRALIECVVAKAVESATASCVLTFEPHPREFFSPDAAPARLTRLRDKLELIAATGVERVHVVRFDARFAALGALQGWAWFAVLFVGGWILQLVGHVYEGRRPALVDNLFQIFVAPIFLCAEVFFALGYKPQLHTAVEQRARRLRAGT